MSNGICCAAWGFRNAAAVAGAFALVCSHAPAARAQTWYLRHDLTTMAPPGANGEGISVDPFGQQATLTTYTGVRMTARWSLPATLTTNAGAAVPLSVQVSGPDPLYNQSSGAGPYMTLMTGDGFPPWTTAQNGYRGGLWDAGRTNYAHSVGMVGEDPPAATALLPGMNPLVDIAGPFELQLSGSGADSVNVFYFYSRDPAPTNDYLVLTSSLPGNGEGVPANQMAAFQATVRYCLRSRTSAMLGFYVYDQANNTVVTNGDFVGVQRSESLGTVILNSPVVYLPESSSNLSMVAYFADEATSQVILRSNTNEFPVTRGMLLELGTHDGGGFTPLGPVGNRCLYMYSDGDQDLRFNAARVSRLPVLAQSDTLQVEVRLRDQFDDVVCMFGITGSAALQAGAQPAELVIPLTKVGGQPVLFRGRVDLLTFVARLKGKGDYSNLVHVPMQNVFIERAEPADSRFVTPSSTVHRVNLQVRYSVADAGPHNVIVRYFGIGCSSGEKTVATGLVRGMMGRIDATADIPVELLNRDDRFTIRFLASLGRARSYEVGYRVPVKRTASLPAGSSSPAAFPGGVITPVTNPSNALLSVESAAMTLIAGQGDGRSDRAEILADQEPVTQGVTSAGGTHSAWSADPPSGSVRFDDFLGIRTYWSFDPPVPAGNGFLADLTLSWTTNDLPSDPNFDVRRLTLASCNAGDTFLRLHATTLDPSNRTATARVDGLDQYYTIGVAGPFAWRTLNVFALRTRGGIDAEQTLVNPSRFASVSTVAPYAAPGTVTTNPAAVALPPRAAADDPLRSRFPADAFAADGWLQAVAQEACGVASALRLADAGRRDQLAAPAPAAPALVVPAVNAGTAGECELHVINPTCFDANATLTVYGPGGAALATNGFALPPFGKRVNSLAEFFPLTPGLGSAAYARLAADSPLACSAILLTGDYLAAMDAQPPAAGGLDEPLHAPLVTAGGFNQAARLVLVNAGAGAATVYAVARSADGAISGGPVALTLTAGQRDEREICGLFGWDWFSETNCVLTITGAVGQVVGALDTTDPFMIGMERFRMLQPLQRGTAGGWVFPSCLVDTGAVATLSVYNPSAATALVSVAVCEVGGRVAGVARLSLPPWSSIRRTMAEWIPAASSLTQGYCVVAADLPVCAGASAVQAEYGWLSDLPGVPWDRAPWQPSLQIGRYAGGSLLSWPAAETACVAEVTESLWPPAPWNPVPGVPTDDGTNRFLPRTPAGAVEFYRLSSPSP